MTNADRMEWFSRVAFAIVSLIHLLPVAGLLGRATLERAYGVSLPSSDLVILMQHRALLFGLLAMACLIAIWQPAWRWPAGLMALVSMLGFVLLATLQPHQAEITRIMWIDVAAALPLLLALAIQAWLSKDPW